MGRLSSSIKKCIRWVSAGALVLASGAAWADSISPTSFSANLAVGESATVRKTVVVSASGPTSAVVDIMFVFDTTGSMGGAIDNAKASATSVLNTLAATYSGGGGSLKSGVGQYDDPGRTIVSNLSSSVSATQTAINSLDACYGSCGGDYEEVGYAGIRQAATDASWAAGSNRFIVVFGDAAFKTGPAALDTEAGTKAALDAAGIKLFGLNFGGSDYAADITGLGGTVFAGGTSPSTVADAIIAAISAGFANYSNVTVGDLGAGLPEIGVSTVCVSAAPGGSCAGAIASGTYDRSIDRTFEFDVTFTRLALGDTTFSTHALVDRGIVASERDTFGGGGTVPEPGSLTLMALGLLALGAVRRRIR